jgi:hypothetical protein
MSWFSVVYGVAMFANEWEMLSRTHVPRLQQYPTRLHTAVERRNED